MPAKKRGKKVAGKVATAKKDVGASSPRAKRAGAVRNTTAKRTKANIAKAVSNAEWQFDESTVESALLTGESAELLQDYFGPENYREVKQLARDAAARGVRGGPRVLVLPGIMGSQIGIAKPFPNAYWFDPIDIAMGNLTKLAMNGGAGPYSALGVLLLYYLKLKLRLRAAGYNADFHAFDWRLSIADLGRALAARMNAEGKNVSLVAHSMGGLVARWAVGDGGAKYSRLIMLGTPNFGSWAPVMAMRAAYPLVRKVGAIDLRNSPEELAQKVFSTFPGLTEMFPVKAKQGTFDVHNLANWPTDKLVPRQPLLDRIGAIHDGMVEKGEHIFMIAGVDQETPVGVVPKYGNGDTKPPTAFDFKYSHEGDGTVPLDYALLPGAKRTYYIAEQHGSLPNNKLVAKAVLDLLDRGETNVLTATRAPGGNSRAMRTISEVDLRNFQPYEGRRGRGLSANELRHVLDEFAAPDAHDVLPTVPGDVASSILAGSGTAAVEGYNHRFDSVVVGRRRQHRLDLRFARGSITQVDARAIAVGIFRDVAPGGAAAAIDARLNGAITELTQRRMFSGGVGEVFVLPTGRHALAADIVAFVGLGDFDRFQDEVLQTAAENLIRTFIRSRIEEFGTVVFGGGTGGTAASGLRNLLVGFIRGLLDADTEHQFRRVVICENNPARYEQLKQELFRLSSTTLCQDVELTFDEIVLPDEPEASTRTSRRAAKGAVPVYLTVRQEPGGVKKIPNIRTSLLTTGDKATVLTGVKALDLKALDALRDRAAAESTTSFDTIGDKIAKLLLTDDIQKVLPRFRQHHLVIVHDAETSRAPWETIALKIGTGDKLWYPAREAGISHRFSAEKLSVAKWLEERQTDGELNVLLVVDPTSDLAGSREEGDRMAKLLGRQANCKLDRLQGKDATRPALLAAFGSGKYDVVHYAGHAGFSETSGGRSGLSCANEAMLTGADLAAVSRLPALVFFNACESARVRKLKGGRAKAKAKVVSNRERAENVQKTVSVAEALMRGGVANFLGTYWPVGDEAAATFASVFYPELVRGETIGVAIQKARAALAAKSNKDWANYIFYGNQDFVLKETAGNA